MSDMTEATAGIVTVVKEVVAARGEEETARATLINEIVRACNIMSVAISSFGRETGWKEVVSSGPHGSISFCSVTSYRNHVGHTRHVGCASGGEWGLWGYDGEVYTMVHEIPEGLGEISGRELVKLASLLTQVIVTLLAEKKSEVARLKDSTRGLANSLGQLRSALGAP